MGGWHHRINAHEFEQTQGDSGGQGSLAAAVHGVARSQTQLSDWMTRLWFTEGSGLVDLLSIPLHLSPYQQFTLFCFLVICVFRASLFISLNNFFLCIHNLSSWQKRPGFWPISAFYMSSSLSLIISSFWFKLRYMYLFLSREYLRGHWRIINWPSLNTVVWGNREACEEGERWGTSSWNTHIYGLNSSSYMGTVCGAWKQIVTSKTTDHWKET